MAKAKKEKTTSKSTSNKDAYIANAGIVLHQPITETLQTNYMPYAMSVIVSRALPEIDGLKPSHRKILYTMYKMGLLNGTKTKSANIVGQTMHLNPHGDQAIYDTMVRLSKGYEALLHPYVESKGNFGKSYSRDMAYAASRYTEAKLAPICAEFFRDMDKDTVDFIPNYDNSTIEPTLFPTTFPSILVNSNVGIAVSMASNICPFNLREICETTIALMKNPEYDILETLKGPDFPSGGLLLFNKDELIKSIDTGRGSFKIRGKYNYDKALNCIEITEIPPTTTVEAIMDKVVDLVKLGKIKEISDIRDETDLHGLKLTLDLKRGQDHEKLIQKLYKMTTLQDNFSCNFNILIKGYPRVMGVREILNEWIAFRIECVKRRVTFDLKKKKEKLHLLNGLKKIMLDIDKAIKIVRETAEETDVVPNLMIGFGIDEIQAEYVAEIRLRQLNKEYILKRTAEIDQLIKDIEDMEAILESRKKILNIITKELTDVIKKFEQPRKTLFLYEDDTIELDLEEEIPDYPVNIFLTKEGYFKKITPQSLRMSGEQKLKETDEIAYQVETTNSCELLFFTDKQQVYKTRACDFDDSKTSLLGDFVPAKLSFDSDEKIVAMVITKDYTGNMLFFFNNGKVAKVPLESYQTKTKRKKLSNAYSDKFDLVSAFLDVDNGEYLIKSSANRQLLFNSAIILPKTTKNTQGVQVMTIKKDIVIENVLRFEPGLIEDAHKYRAKAMPSTGGVIPNKNQIKL